MDFRQLLNTYRLEDRTLFGLIETNDSVTLRFDLYHCDDDERCRDGTEYVLDVRVPSDRFGIIEGAGERLREAFSADILATDLRGNELHLLADCSFYPSRTRGVVEMVLTGGTVEVTEHPPAPSENFSVSGSFGGPGS